MQLTVLGSGTSVPDPDRGPAGFLLQCDGHSYLIDGGSGTLQRCARAGVDPRTLDAGIFTHRHPDHCADLVPLLFSMRVGPPSRSTPYRIVGGHGWRAYVEALDALYGDWLRFKAPLLVEELPLQGPGSFQLSERLWLRTLPAVHSASALHLRFEHPAGVIVLSGDTAPSDNLVTLASGADLLVVECAGSDDSPVPGHLWPSAIREMVERARPEEVWLHHLYPHVDPAVAVATVAGAGRPTRHTRDLEVWLTPTRSSPEVSS